MLTHVHKVIHLVVGVFEQGLGNFTGALDRKDEGHWKRPDASLGWTDTSGQWQKRVRVSVS